MRERVKLVHRVIDFGEQRPSVRRGAKQRGDDVSVPRSQCLGYVAKGRFVTFRCRFRAAEQRVGHTGERRNDDDGPAPLGLRDLNSACNGGRIGERRPAELVNGYGRHY